MANPEHVERLLRNVDEWNDWRDAHPDIIPDLSGAYLENLDLTMANLSNADLSSADLILANLRAADLSFATLTGANLVGARLIGVDLDHADLRGSNLCTAEDLTVEQLAETYGDQTTGLPEGLARPKHWLNHDKQVSAT